MTQEEITTEKKFANWYVWQDGQKKNITTQIPMTPSQALKHFHADAVQGIEEEYTDKFKTGHNGNIMLLLALCVVLTSCGGGDGTVENWFVLILLMLCWLKGVLF